MFVKLIVVLLLFIIIASLGSALLFLVQDKGQSNRVVKALTLRIGLSIAAFVILMLSYYAGLIQPHGITP